MRIRLCTVIWGKDFTDIFLRITMRSLLAEGNVPALPARHEVAYTIYTTADDARILLSSPTFRRMQSVLPVQIVTFERDDIDPKNPSSHWILWRRAAAEAKRDGVIIFFVIPDMLYARGTLLHWALLLEQGRRAVCAAAPQVVLDSALAEIEEQFPPSTDMPISIDLAAAHRLLIRHIHPLMVCMFRDSGRYVWHPDTVVAAATGQGVVMRVLASQPFCIDLNHFAVTDAFSPVDHLDAIAFDQPRGICLEPMLKHPGLYDRVGPLDENRLSNFGSWVDLYLAAPADVLWTYQNARFLGHEKVDERSLRRAEAGLGFLAGQLRLTGAIYRVWRALHHAGCHWSARITAAAHYSGRLRRHWRVKGPVTVLAPSDAALSSEAAAIETLLHESRAKILADVVLAHVFPGSLMLAPGYGLQAVADAEESMTAASGALFRRSPALTATRIIAGPIEVDDCTIYVVDRPLAFPPSRLNHPPPSATRPSLVGPNRHLGEFAAASEHGRSRLPLTARFHDIGRRLQSLVMYRRAALPASLSSALDARVEEAFHLLQAARVVLTLAEVLRFYRKKMVDLCGDFPPLKLVEDCLASCSLSEDRLLGEWRSLTQAAPDFAEGWLELGLAHLDRGESEEAERCFDRSLAAQPRLPVSPGRMTCAARACFARARAQEARGRMAEAADSYRTALAIDPQPTMMRLAYAGLLRRLGRWADALLELDAAMETDVTAMTLPRLPRHFATLSDRLAGRFGGVESSPAETRERLARYQAKTVN